MKENFFILLPIVFGVIAGDYVGPQNGFKNGNGNGNGNAYGVPTDSITPPQPQGGPYPPSGWKPAGRRLLLPGESRGAQQPIDSGYGQPPPPQYGPVNPAPSGPSIDSQYVPSVDNTGPPNNQYIPGSGFGNGGNGGNGNGHNGNSHGNGNGNSNGNGHGNGNGNGQGVGNGNGNGHGNGNGNGNGFGTTGNGNGNGHNGGNGFGGTGNGNGANGNANGNGLATGNGHNGSNGNKGANGSNGFAPGFHGAFPGGLIYPFIQHSVPAVLAFRPGNGAGQGSIYPLYQVPINPQSGTGFIASSLPTGQGVFPLASVHPSTHNVHASHDLGAIYPGIQITGTPDVAGSQPAVIAQGNGFIGNGIGPYYTFLTNHQSQKSNILGVPNRLTNLQLQYPVGHAAYGNAGVPLSVF